MKHTDNWQALNERYLTASLAWLRLELDLFARGRERAASAEHNISRSAKRKEASDLAVARQARAAAAEIDPPPALVELERRLGLTKFERDTLFLSAAPEFDPSIALLCARAQGDARMTHPTFALATALFQDMPDCRWDARTAARPLRYWYLVELNQPGVEWLGTSPLAADEQIVGYIGGVRQMDDRLAPFLSSMRESYLDPTALPESQSEILGRMLGAIRSALETPEAAQQRLPMLQLVGADAASKRTLAVGAASALGLEVYRLSLDLAPTSPPEVERFARLWQRASMLLPLALYIDAADTEPTPALNRLLSRINGLVFMDVREVWSRSSEPYGVYEIQNPVAREQRVLWSDILETTPDSEAAVRLAGCFDLDAVTIRRLAIEAQRSDRDVFELCRQHARTRMEGLAQRINPRAKLDDLVLSTEAEQLLKQLVAQTRHRLTVYDAWGWRARMNRGLGISALFAGDSGTGKTMAAEAVTNELGLDLYRIDLSAVVSKYIGETEKNLRRVFDAAEQGGAVLFFDEADALFGKRSEVKDSHDRYANIEINYLLQRMEEFAGLAILATNMKQALDPAFMRRLRFIVNFAYPGIPEREQIWQQEFPTAMDTSALDWTRLSKFNLTGGNIHSVALNASFLAAAAESPNLNMELVLRAVRDEYHKLERSASDADFWV